MTAAPPASARGNDRGNQLWRERRIVWRRLQRAWPDEPPLALTQAADAWLAAADSPRRVLPTSPGRAHHAELLAAVDAAHGRHALPVDDQKAQRRCSERDE